MKAIEERYLFLQSQYYKLLGLALDRETTTKEVLECHQNFVDYEATCTKEDLDHADKVLADTSFKVGDRVIHQDLGKGTVVAIDSSLYYPYEVDFKRGSRSWCSPDGIWRIENE